MAMSHEPVQDNPIDFRAPPPSPIASGRRSSVANDEILTEFLEHSLRVPDLILPDKIFPKQKIVETPSVIDFQSLNSLDRDSFLKVIDSATRIGCFQIVNHGIPSELLSLVTTEAAGIFTVSPEKKAAVTRSSDKHYGFEEVHAEEERNELGDEFVWCKDESLDLAMEGIWPAGYSNFCKKIETLSSAINIVAEKITQTLQLNIELKTLRRVDEMSQQAAQAHAGPVCYLYKHKQNISAEKWANLLRYDVIRMLIRGADSPHALCLHICNGSLEFHVYSKKGWLSFCPDQDAIVVTVGDQLQGMSKGEYKHVLGRPIYKGEKEDCISMAFLCSPLPSTNNDKSSSTGNDNTTTETRRESKRTISLGQQAILALILTLLYQLLVFLYKKH